MNNTENKNNQTECDELRDLIPAYMLGATTAEESARVQELLPRCPELSTEVEDYAALVHGLSTTVPRHQPDASVKTGLMAKLAAQEGSASTSSVTSHQHVVDDTPSQPPVQQITIEKMPTEQAPRSKTPWWLAAAACFLLIVSNIYWLSEINNVQAELDIVRQRQADVINALTISQRGPITLASTDDNNVVATILWDSSANVGTLTTNSLPELDDTRTYQLWLINDSGAFSAGLFNIDAIGSGVYTFTAESELEQYNAIGISIEPAAGSDAPTTTPIAVGEI